MRPQPFAVEDGRGRSSRSSPRPAALDMGMGLSTPSRRRGTIQGQRMGSGGEGLSQDTWCVVNAGTQGSMKRDRGRRPPNPTTALAKNESRKVGVTRTVDMRSSWACGPTPTPGTAATTTRQQREQADSSNGRNGSFTLGPIRAECPGVSNSRSHAWPQGECWCREPDRQLIERKRQRGRRHTETGDLGVVTEGLATPWPKRDEQGNAGGWWNAEGSAGAAG